MARQLSVNERIEIFKIYQTCSASESAAIFNERHPERPFVLNPRTVRKIAEKFNQTGSVENRKNDQRYCKSKDPNVIDQVTNIFNDNPHTTLKQARQETGLAIQTISKCLKSRKYYPYKYAKAHILQRPEDLFNRVNYCCDILGEIENDPDFFSKVLWSDESLFPVNGLPNRQNFR